MLPSARKVQVPGKENSQLPVGAQSPVLSAGDLRPFLDETSCLMDRKECKRNGFRSRFETTEETLFRVMASVWLAQCAHKSYTLCRSLAGTAG